MHKQTPSQTVGPFYSIGMIRSAQNDLTNERTLGQRIIVRGRVLDGEDDAVTDAVVEVWQADSRGIYNHPDDPRHEQADPNFRGYGRVGTTMEQPEFTFKTIKPGSVAVEGEPRQAPHLNVHVFARGMLVHATTRIYFSDESDNQTDPVLGALESERRATLIAAHVESPDLPTYRFDIHLQGEQETVFFDP